MDGGERFARPPSAESNPATDDLIRTMAKAEGFVRMLRDGPKFKPELASELGVSKSTVYNWATELIDYDVVRRTDDGYELTPLGEQLVQLYCYTSGVTAQLYDTKSLLRTFPSDHHPPFCALTDAEVVDAESNPYAPHEAFVEWMSGADHVTGFPSLFSTEKLEALAAKISSGELTANVVVEQSDAELLCRRSPEILADILEEGEVYVTNRDIPIRLFVAEDRSPSVGVAVQTASGHLSVFARLSGEEAVEWGHELYERYRSTAECLEVPQ